MPNASSIDDGAERPVLFPLLLSFVYTYIGVSISKVEKCTLSSSGYVDDFLAWPVSVFLTERYDVPYN